MKFKFISHSKLSSDDVKKIVELKNIHWKYTFEQHLSWMETNLLDDDIHIMMFEDEELVGYMNLVNITVTINSEDVSFLGIGNVCSRDKFSGFGRKLLIGANNYLIENSKNGILLCKDDLVGFYEKFDWKLIDKKNIFSSKLQDINLMTFDFDENIESLKYEDRNF